VFCDKGAIFFCNVSNDHIKGSIVSYRKHIIDILLLVQI
jgi:hypothetical protein